MIRIATLGLPGSAESALLALQRDIDHVTSYPERVTRAAVRFAEQNRPTNKTFQDVRATLASMCCGARRCMYCEDSNADQIEHFRPKSFYPELVFVWLNYLYSCGSCNRSKLNHFRILSGPDEYVDLTRAARAIVVPPKPGNAVLLDPRHENPLDYLTLDFLTFHFAPSPALGAAAHLRADYTIK